MGKKEPTKKPITLSIEIEIATRLDEWIQWQKDVRGYEIDRSHIANVLLRRFLDRNDSHIKEKSPSLMID